MRARDLAAVMALTAGCAPQDAGERMVAPAPLDAPAPLREPDRAEAENEDGDELGLAEYERLLADKETRLRAAGVLLAARGQGAEEARDDRFAAPAPVTAATPQGGVAADENLAAGGTTAKSKRAAKGAGAGRSGDVAAEPAPPPPPAPKKPSTSTASRDSREKKVFYDARPTQTEAAAGSVPKEESAEPVGRCQNICDLSAATCDLEGKICDLAARHADDPRYGELCRRADDDCRQAAEACQRCSP